MCARVGGLAVGVYSLILAIAIPFGRFVNFLYLKPKCQAMIEFESTASSSRMLSFASRHSLRIRGKEVSVRTSTHHSLQTVEDRRSYFFQFQDSFGLEDAKKVLHVVTDSATRASFRDFEDLFMNFGNVQRLIVFEKRGRTQALVQFSTLEAAIIAKATLDGQRVFSDFARLHVNFSRNSQISITRNSDRFRDYSVHSESGWEDSRRHRTDSHREPISKYKEETKASLFEANTSTKFDNKHYDKKIQRTTDYHMRKTSRSCTILVNNLPRDISCDDLYNFIGYYGDILRIKILYRKPDSALIQMVDSQMAKQVYHYIHQIPFHDQNLHVCFSNYDSITMPGENVESPHLTRDYSESNMGRYKHPGSKNYRNIYPPSRVLHVSNLSNDITTDEIKQLFQKVARVGVEKIEFLRNLGGQAFVFTTSTTDAIYGIMKLHNYTLPNSTQLKVSFSKQPDDR